MVKKNRDMLVAVVFMVVFLPLFDEQLVVKIGRLVERENEIRATNERKKEGEDERKMVLEWLMSIVEKY